MGKGYNYRPRTKVTASTNQKKNVRTVQQVIRKVERLELEDRISKLKITTMSGTKVEISSADYDDNKWSALWNFLSEGDVVKIEHWAGRIQNAYVEVDQQCFLALQTSFEKPEELLLMLENANSERRIAKIRQSDIESQKTLSQNGYGTVYDYAQTCERWAEAVEDSEDVYATIFGERVVIIEFEAPWWDD